jgi:hypothetical protein
LAGRIQWALQHPAPTANQIDESLKHLAHFAFKRRLPLASRNPVINGGKPALGRRW